MPRVAPLALVRGPDPEGSAIVGARIAAARAVALARPSGALNGRLTGRALREACTPRPRGPSDGSSPSPTSNGPADAAPNACFASRGRSRTWREVSRSSEDAPRRGGLVPVGRHAAGRRRGRLRCSAWGRPARPASRRWRRPRRPDPRHPSARCADPRPRADERDAWAVLAGVRGLGPVGFGALLGSLRDRDRDPARGGIRWWHGASGGCPERSRGRPIPRRSASPTTWRPGSPPRPQTAEADPRADPRARVSRS